MSRDWAEGDPFRSIQPNLSNNFSNKTVRDEARRGANADLISAIQPI